MIYLRLIAKSLIINCLKDTAGWIVGHLVRVPQYQLRACCREETTVFLFGPFL